MEKKSELIVVEGLLDALAIQTNEDHVLVDDTLTT